MTSTHAANVQLCAVHMVDVASCSDPARFLSSAMLSLLTMIRLEMPHVNVLSKLDTFAAYGRDTGACHTPPC